MQSASSCCSGLLNRFSRSCVWARRASGFQSGSKTYYEILGVSKDASQKEIKNAFYTLSKKYHPDVNGRATESESTMNFMMIKDAYDVLRDTEKRRVYDMQLMPGSAQSFNYDPFYRARHTAQRKPHTEADFEEIFKQFRNHYGSRAYREYAEEMRNRAWEAHMRQREELFRRKSSRYARQNNSQGPQAHNDDFPWKFRPEQWNHEANILFLNKILGIYLVVFFVVSLARVVMGSSDPGNWKAPQNRKEFDDAVESTRRSSESLLKTAQLPKSEWKDDGKRWTDVIDEPNELSRIDAMIAVPPSPPPSFE